MSLPVLPVYYYHDHFNELVRFVTETYGAVLTDAQQTFFARFKQLSKDAQCLLIRMINRQGRIFRPRTFRYAEITDIDSALTELSAAGHVRSLVEDDFAAFLGCLSKEALLKAGRDAALVDMRSSWPKAKLAEHLISRLSFETAYIYCGGRDFVALGDIEAIEFLLYLYFGKTQTDLKSFALRDLGILRTNKETNFSARFSDGDEARACFTYSQLLDHLDGAGDAAYRQAVATMLSGPHCPSDFSEELRSRAAHKTGIYFEKKGEAKLAVQLYRLGISAECNERLVRLLYATGEREAAQELLRRMIDDPACDNEFVFASDFYARKFNGQRAGLCTELLRAGQTVTVDDCWRGNPEAGVASVMRRQGRAVFYTENTLWHGLFGLLFWDELFESGQLHSGFDWVPHCLKDRSFARLFAATIETKLAAVTSQAALPFILRTVATKWGKPNGIFAWDHVNMDTLRTLLAGASPSGIATMLRLMCEDFRATRDGFPDLMLDDHGAISFMEVKAEGDAIRRNQLTRLRQLGQAGISAVITRVEFTFDPEQDYIVVDIETTGGWTGGDRITEIGAVKIRNHEVVEEWHSLINPQRHIPLKITHLTGITNDMVREAPLFSEVAEPFMQFMGDGIFVAHNVNFDYGFLASEYERLERRFRFPKLCTCAGMRRRYPGHASYSLGNLCQVYEIDLKNHHRALADARAAAQLLNLINENRHRV
jgi:DNA polymerase-3 subunit epsilon